MKKTLLASLAIVLGASAMTAATVTAPEAGKYYRIRHSSGKVLANTFKSTLVTEAEDNNQIVQFEAVPGTNPTV